MLDSSASSDTSTEATSPPRTRRRSANGAKKHGAKKNGAKQNGAAARDETDTTTDDDDGVVRRRTRAQSKTREAESPSNSDDSARKTRRGRRGQQKTSPSPVKPKTTTKRVTKPAQPVRSPPSEDEDASDAPGDYIPVQVGDTVLLDSGDPDDQYIALVSAVQTSQRRDKPISSFTAQWYYKPDDVAEEVLAMIPGGVVEKEVFLSPHKDKNSIDAVIEICQVVSPEEYNEIQDEIKRGFREKGKTYFVCRYKYYPGRTNLKKALEAIENEAIRSGLGRPKPNIGENYQASVPEFTPPPPPATAVKGPEGNSQVPWKDHPEPTARPRQVWSPLVPKLQKDIFFQFLDMVDELRFAVGNIVKIYRDVPNRKGHVRGIVLRSPREVGGIHLCLSTGQVTVALTSEVCSLLTDDMAMQHLYLSRFNVCLAAQECSARILDAQQSECDAFRREVALFSQLAEAERVESDQATADLVDVDSTRKRRK